jgi:hypothetical protein
MENGADANFANYREFKPGSRRWNEPRNSEISENKAGQQSLPATNRFTQQVHWPYFPNCLSFRVFRVFRGFNCGI